MATSGVGVLPVAVSLNAATMVAAACAVRAASRNLALRGFVFASRRVKTRNAAMTAVAASAAIALTTSNAWMVFASVSRLATARCVAQTGAVIFAVIAPVRRRCVWPGRAFASRSV